MTHGRPGESKPPMCPFLDARVVRLRQPNETAFSACQCDLAAGAPLLAMPTPRSTDPRPARTADPCVLRSRERPFPDPCLLVQSPDVVSDFLLHLLQVPRHISSSMMQGNNRTNDRNPRLSSRFRLRHSPLLPPNRHAGQPLLRGAGPTRNRPPSGSTTCLMRSCLMPAALLMQSFALGADASRPLRSR